MVVVPEEVAQPVDRETRELAGKTAARASPQRRLDGDDHVSEKRTLARRIGLAPQILLVKAEDVGGAIELAVAAVELAYLGVAGQEQRYLRARAVESAQRRPDPRDQPRALRPVHQPRNLGAYEQLHQS